MRFSLLTLMFAAVVGLATEEEIEVITLSIQYLVQQNKNYISTTQVLANENSYDKNPDKPIVVGGVVFPEQVCLYTVSLFLRNISSSKYIGAKLETKSVTCALCPKTSSWFILQLCTTRSEFVFCFQFTSSSNLSYTLRLSTEYLERARLISIVKFQQNKSNNFKVLRNWGELSHIARCNFSYQPLPTKHHVPKF